MNRVRCPQDPQRVGQKRKVSDFPRKLNFCGKKVCYKVSLRENFQPQTCRTFITLYNVAQMVGGGHPL